MHDKNSLCQVTREYALLESGAQSPAPFGNPDMWANQQSSRRKNPIQKSGKWCNIHKNMYSTIVVRSVVNAQSQWKDSKMATSLKLNEPIGTISKNIIATANMELEIYF